MAANLARRTVATLIVVIALALLVPPFINVNRYRGRMAESLSRAVGRPVTIGAVEMRLIPQPGFDMDAVEIGDDPAISNEPILRAEHVTAYLRLSSLWRGRLEIAKLNLQYPSLNLVRGDDGHWNLESLLWRASRTPVAPTSQSRAEARVRFPYIEVEQGRVNFKYGLEKQAFSFTDADFALFSPAENEWRMRLEAKPVRTDTNISDTGTLKADISFQRAEMLRDTAVHGKIAWERGQLGMITKLIYGRDRGWRGMLDMQSEVSGSPAELHFSSTASVRDFRRYDIYAGEALGMNATCSGVASISFNSVPGFNCTMPAGSGSVTVSGSMAPRAQTYDVSLAVENVTANSVANLVRHVKKDIPLDLTASGTVNAAASFQRTTGENSSRAWMGKGSTTEVTLRSSLLKEPIALKPLSFALKTPGEAPTARKAHGKNAKNQVAELPGQFLTVAPFAVGLGAKTPATMEARLGTTSFEIRLTGPGELEHLISFGRTLGVSVPKVTLRGELAMELAMTGTWQGLPQPSINGTAKVTNGRAEVPGIAREIVVTQSEVALMGNEFQLRGMQGQAGDLRFTGSATIPRHCEADTPCGPGVELQFEDLDVAKLNALVNPNLKQQPWYKLFGSSKEESLLSKIYAVGRITAKRVDLDRLVGTKFYADFRLNNGDLLVSNMTAAVMGGTHSGQWRADFSGAAPVYTGSGTLTRVNVAQTVAVTKAVLGTGNVSGRYELKMTGWNATDLARSAEGNAAFDWSNATIRAFAPVGRGPSKVSDFNGKLLYKDGVLNFNESRMLTAAGIYSVTGTADGEKLALELKSDTATGYKVTGTIRAPEVAAEGHKDSNAGEQKKVKTEALLKP